MSEFLLPALETVSSEESRMSSSFSTWTSFIFSCGTANSSLSGNMKSFVESCLRWMQLGCKILQGALISFKHSTQAVISATRGTSQCLTHMLSREHGKCCLNSDFRTCCSCLSQVFVCQSFRVKADYRNL